ncbi:hypothetical protein QTN25_001940 [Entamoeba marina]
MSVPKGLFSNYFKKQQEKRNEKFLKKKKRKVLKVKALPTTSNEKEISDDESSLENADDLDHMEDELEVSNDSVEEESMDSNPTDDEEEGQLKTEVREFYEMLLGGAKNEKKTTKPPKRTKKD